ncbi:MAG: ParA family protein [Deltaproteobacteria bacterium]|nr:ParA family protein [Deltaproteobacteria bacterium]
MRPTSVENLFLAPAAETLASADLNLAALMGRERYLQNTLANGIGDDFDFVLIDTGPYLGLLTINAYVASTHLIVPVSCEYLPMLGLKLLVETVDKVRQKLHPDLSILGFLLTMYDRRERVTFTVEDELRGEFGDRLFDTRIRVNTKHRSAPASRATIFEYEHSERGKGTQDYSALTDEVLARLSGG